MCIGERFGSSLVSGVELEVDSESQVVAPRLSLSVISVARLPGGRGPLPRQEGAGRYWQGASGGGAQAPPMPKCRWSQALTKSETSKQGRPKSWSSRRRCEDAHTESSQTQLPGVP